MTRPPSKPAHRKPLWLCGCGLTALALGSLPAAGQSSTCGWSFIETVDVPPTLQALRDRAGEVPDWLPDAEAKLLRWYRECDETGARVAAHDLQSVQSRTNSSDPLLLAWLGVALVRGPEVQVPRAEGAFLRSTHRSSNAERDGARLLARVVESHDWPEVAGELAAVAVATRKGETLDLASRTLRTAAEARGNAELWTALAEVELARGDRDAAERTTEREGTAASARGLRVAGILQMRDGNDEDGAALYLSGLAMARTDAEVQPFFDDLRLILGDDERGQWESLEGGRAEWIRHKWEWRARMSGVRLAERLGVNQRRLDEALTLYDRASFRGSPGEYPVWSYESGAWRRPLDDRGILFLRHGPPATELGRRGSRIAWVYGGPTSRPMVFEFSGGFGKVVRSEYFLAEPPPCDRLSQGVATIQTQTPEEYANELAAWDPALGWYYMRCLRSPEVGMSGYADARTTAQETADAAWSSESGIVRFDKPLNSAWNLYAFQTPTGPELVNFVAVEVGGLPGARAASARFDFDLLVSVGHPVTETSIQVDTSFGYSSSSPLPGDAVLQFVLPIRTPANGKARVIETLRNRNDDTQGRVASTTWNVPAFDGTLLLSDLVVGQPRNGILHRGTHAISPASGHAVLENAPFRLYYELYGARANDPLSVTIRVLPGTDPSFRERLQSLISSRSAISIEFEEQARIDADGAMRVERDLQADLAPGSYSVVVSVRDDRTGQTSTRDTNLIVVER